MPEPPNVPKSINRRSRPFEQAPPQALIFPATRRFQRQVALPLGELLSRRAQSRDMQLRHYLCASRVQLLGPSIGTSALFQAQGGRVWDHSALKTYTPKCSIPECGSSS